MYRYKVATGQYDSEEQHQSSKIKKKRFKKSAMFDCDEDEVSD